MILILKMLAAALMPLLGYLLGQQTPRQKARAQRKASPRLPRRRRRR